ncbi:hypothetical protein KCP91_13345 [Microvirga sp. SRT01]|uniref:Uncharacterized protein n=1 Tax=Sphingomonas longa TaxID=2778730 RepID=A0ABS2D8Y8_9SPHN|nr:MULTISPECIES: hypothetical protein [Alphaproteobacteria]MBM6577363.1 hypothetical protein [Sphingomonas sp. BT552]MBR7710408.1 hypothetical protein [Microvirga sp. SRT01]
MDISIIPIAERIARVLTAQRISANAAGDEESAAATIDANWQDHLPDALAVLRTLREPDEAMAAAGDVAIWERMVLTAIDHATTPRVVL